MSSTKTMPGLLSDSLAYWKTMPEDDLEAFEQLPPYIQEHIKRLAFYADQVPELLEACEELLDNAYPPEWSVASRKPFDRACNKVRNVIAKTKGISA